MALAPLPVERHTLDTRKAMEEFLLRYPWGRLLTLTFEDFPGQRVAAKQVAAHVQSISQFAYGRRWRGRAGAGIGAVTIWEGQRERRHAHVLLYLPVAHLRRKPTGRDLVRRWRRGHAQVRCIDDQSAAVNYVLKEFKPDTDFELSLSLADASRRDNC